ncbi:MAG: DUF2269 family protein [bacterium]|nr:DUF2269 family protein [bacterium]
MSLYLFLKVIHLLGVSLFAGISFSNGYAASSAVRSGDLARIEFAFDLVARQNRVFLIPSTLILFATGLWMALLTGTPVLSGWLAEVLALYTGLVGLLWLAVHLEARLHRLSIAAREVGELPVDFARLMRCWSSLGLLASVGIILMVAIMTAKISLLNGGMG